MGADNGNGGCFHPISQSPNTDVFKTSKPRKTVPTNRSPPSAISVPSTNRVSHQKSNDRHSSADMFNKLDHKETSGCKIEAADLNTPSLKLACEDGTRRSFVRNLESGENENGENSKPETKRALFSKPCDEKVHKFGSLRSGSRVVPFQDDENPELNAVVSNIVEEVHENNKDVEDLSLIREQLLQIEHQQFSLLELLQVCFQS